MELLVLIKLKTMDIFKMNKRLSGNYYGVPILSKLYLTVTGTNMPNLKSIEQL